MKRQQTSLLNNRIERLAHRYFEATATPDEERELCRLLAETSDSRYDDIRACLGFIVTAKRHHQVSDSQTDSGSVPTVRKRWLAPVLTITSAAAVVALFALIALRPSAEVAESEDCWAYVGGKKQTDETEVLKIMKNELATVIPSSDADETIEAQLKDVLSEF